MVLMVIFQVDCWTRIAGWNDSLPPLFTKENFWHNCSRCFRGQLPYLSPNQQYLDMSR